MPVRDDEVIRLAGWPKGVNNVAREDELGADELRAGVNVDLPNSGKPQRRPGYTQRLTGAWHSVYGGWPVALLAVRDGDLTALDANLTPTTVLAGVGTRDVSYAAAPDGCYWTNGVHIGRINPDTLAAEPVWPDAPGQPVVTAHATGGLEAGTYQVAVTFRDPAGRESGSTLATVVDLTAGQGIRLTGFPAVPSGTTARVYVTPPDGDVLYHAADVLLPMAQWIVGAHQPGKALETQWLYPLPPGRIIRHHGMRTYLADGPVLRWSPAMRHGLTHGDNYWRFSQPLDMVEPIGQADGSGVYVGCGGHEDGKSGRTYFLAGPDPKNWRQLVARHSGVVPGTSRVVPGNWFGLEAAEAVAWLSTDGVFCLGLPTGQVVPLTEGRLALPGAEAGAMMIRERSGLRQLIATMLTGVGASNAFAAQDAAVATVRRHGVTTD